MIQLIRGFKDILPTEATLWQQIERKAVDLFQTYGYGEIRVPIMEKTDLFSRSIGQDTDIVEKEMYTFADRKGDLLTLRPEATASVVRAYIQHKLYADDPMRKFYLIGPMFRRERPQKGRYRQFYQIDVEAFGIAAPYIDVQMIAMLHTLFTQLGVTDTQAHLNSLGCPDCRPSYRDALFTLLDGVEDQLCEDCRRRKDRNPLRVLDCKVPGCREAVAQAPAISDYLCTACADHFNTVTRSLETLASPLKSIKSLYAVSTTTPGQHSKSRPRPWAPKAPWPAAAVTMDWWKPWAARVYRPSDSPSDLTGWLRSSPRPRHRNSPDRHCLSPRWDRPLRKRPFIGPWPLAPPVFRLKWITMTGV